METMKTNSEQSYTAAQLLALERLEWLNREAQLSWGEIARRLAVRYHVVSRWKNRHVAPSQMAISLIERLYTEVQETREQS
jgi:DNA-binding transcriptional regulator YiaG